MDRGDIHLYNIGAALAGSGVLVFLGAKLLTPDLRICFPVFMAGFLIAFYWGSTAGYSAYHTVLVKDGKYSDLGPGTVRLGMFRWTHQVKTYDPAFRSVENTFNAQTKDGRFVKITMSYRWKPDRDALDEYFENNYAGTFEGFMTTTTKQAAKVLTARQIFDAPRINLGDHFPGVIMENLVFYDILDAATGDLSAHIRDNSHLIESMIDEVHTEAELDATFEYLKTLLPDREDRIKRLAGNKKAKLRKSGM